MHGDNVSNDFHNKLRFLWKKDGNQYLCAVQLVNFLLHGNTHSMNIWQQGYGKGSLDTIDTVPWQIEKICVIPSSDLNA